MSAPLTPEQEQTARIRQLNDLLRETFLSQLGRVILTDGVLSLNEIIGEEIITQIRTFKAFTPENDPYGEHDFGAVTVAETKCFWKIDYYDCDYQYGSENPADLDQTRRVLTIMLASEY